MLRLGLQFQYQCRLEVSGGTTETIFPRTEKRLQDPELQDALEFVAARKNMDKYRSMMDFLFCETFPAWRPRCFDFYKNRGPSLRSDPHVDKELLRLYDHIMHEFVIDAILLTWKEERKSWSSMKQCVQEAAETVQWIGKPSRSLEVLLAIILAEIV